MKGTGNRTSCPLPPKQRLSVTLRKTSRETKQRDAGRNTHANAACMWEEWDTDRQESRSLTSKDNNWMHLSHPSQADAVLWLASISWLTKSLVGVWVNCEKLKQGQRNISLSVIRHKYAFTFCRREGRGEKGGYDGEESLTELQQGGISTSHVFHYNLKISKLTRN